ncbi:hypothetical protein BGZ99_007381 [Dissophora globulifera]|uniref:F-box domain-containing protein n=1 Tax=Dissophora globulifera TaxID=979702 RepID=A0A9P6RUG0_9FUNG|nr:hypothetical protein BGZ99_007381 [Dissophora globulifera]
MPVQRGHKKSRLDASVSLDAHSATSQQLVSPFVNNTLQVQEDPMAFFSEEVALHILELLSPADLSKCACVSRLWHRLVNDQMLWRRLFLKYRFVFPRGLNTSRTSSRLQSTKRTTTNQHLKRKRSPQRTEIQLQPRGRNQISFQQQCWKALYRLNYNWIMGQARVTSVSVQELHHRDQHAFNATHRIQPDMVDVARPWVNGCSPIVRFKGSVVVVASPSGLVHLWRIPSRPRALDTVAPESDRPEFWQTYQHSRPIEDKPLEITCLALDTSTGTLKDWQKVVIGYDTGHFSVFEYKQQGGVRDSTTTGDGVSNTENNNEREDEVTLRELGNTSRLPVWSEVGRIQTISYHHPIVTTYSDDGAISIYLIATESDSGSATHWCRLLHRLYGTSSESPIAISLERITPSQRGAPDDHKESIRWRTLLSFGLELYDGSWTVRLQEVEFDEHYILYSTEIGTEDNGGGVAGEKHVDMDDILCDTSFPAYFKSTASGLDSSSCSPSLGHARIGAISAISISWPFVVTTHSDNTMNVFRMARKVDKESTRRQNFDSHTPHTFRRERLRFQHLSTLYGHCGAVSSVSIESRSGRLVSASMDRSIKVWTMAMKNRENQLEQQRIHQCSVSMSDINKSWTEGGQVTKEEGLGLVWVGSDEEKIVSMNCDGTVKVWQFS